MASSCDEAIEALRKRGLSELGPLGIVLGSGLGPLADEVEGATSLAYEDLPGFPVPTVSGHAGRLVVGRLEASASPCSRGAAIITSAATPGRWRSPSRRSSGSAAARCF